ncbi:EAL domain-containing protein [Nitrosomonas sp. Is37]|uniref:sensor domain-containing phosphodiesterase n=1 Tax=Nitrosomonas sp. Is37 TaxID=3080535 RepID=UPI00294B1850|nr:EAL domain-containing protein [Nitrosomonas sp. Is37]MDV6344171.1 EAL domain-containing protein [Nitrosomonas sp. Is37]
MKTQVFSKFNVVKFYLVASIAIATTGSLTAINYFIIELEPQIINILWIILIITIFAMIIQITRAEKSLAKHQIIFRTHKERLTNEIKYRLRAEKTSSEHKTRLQIIDENFPVMLAYFNTEQLCCYHNRAYRLWFGLNAEQIDNRYMREFLNEHFYHGIKNCINHILAGEIIQNKRIQKLTNGSTCLIIEQFVPHFDPKGKVIGFYTLYTPRILRENQQFHDVETQEYTKSENILTQDGSNDKGTTKESESKYSSSASINSATRLIQAIEQDKFHLYYQNIISTKSDSNPCAHYEILIRMVEEENNLIPPGAFLSFVEKYNLMPRLDRWVVSNIIKWLCTNKINSNIMFCINLARDTLSDLQFTDFVEKQLQESNVPPQTLCFEIEESDAKSNLEATTIFAQKIRQIGCKASLSSFNHDRASFDLLKTIKIDFLKIEGSLICNILNDPTDLVKVREINRIAHLMKIQTIAESVESLEIAEKLHEMGVDFAQGFGIAQPQSLKELE